jgi:pentatricopeptide repeat-containing protein PET309
MLDFLYPPKTLALMRRMSEYGTRRKGTFGMAASSSRTFTSKARTAANEQIVSSAHIIASLGSEKPDPKYTTANPLEKLNKLLKQPLPAHSKSGDYEAAWQLYLQLDPKQRTQRIFISLINHLSFSTRSEDAIRSSWLIDESPLLKSQNRNDRSATRFWAALVQQLRMGNAEAAVDVHQNAMDSKAEGYIGTNLLLAQLLQAKEWNLALQIFKSKMATIADANKGWLKDDRADLWDFVDRLPNLLSLTSTILAQMKAGPQFEGRYVQDFIHKLIIKAVVQSLQSKANRKDCRSIRDLISHHGSHIPGLHDVIIKQLLLVLKSMDLQARNYLDLSQLLADLHDNNKASGHYHANDRLLFDTAVVMAKSAPVAARSRWWGFSHSQFSKKVVEMTVEYEELVGLDRSYGLKTAAMRMHAALGNSKEVIALFDQLGSQRPLAEIVALPVLELFAYNTEPDEAEVFFERLRDEFVWQPTTRCWNTLLRAFARADDIGQGVSYFEEMLVSEVGLDAHSYLPILQLYSRRGESAKIVSLLEMAQANDVKMDAKMFFYLVVAHLENGDLAAAEEAAQALIQARKQGNIEGPITIVWNALLEAFGRQRDWGHVMRIYNSMVEENIAPNTQTHAALLEALCKMHNSGEAWKLLQGLHKQNNRDVIPAHYREVMLGFINQRQPMKALMVYDRMCEAGIKPDGAIIALHTRAKSLFEAHDVEPTEAEKQIIDQKFSKKFEEVTELAPVDPGKGTRQVLGGAKEAVAATLIMNYGSANQADTVAKWFDLYIESQEARGNVDLHPMTILRALMTSFLYAGNDVELEKCWEQYVQQAEIFATNVTARKPFETKEDNPEVPSSPPPLYNSRRHLLSAPLVLYMRSLSSQGKRSQIQATVLAILERGWKLDNIAWNEYVRCLVARTAPGDLPTGEPGTASNILDAEEGVVAEEERVRSEMDDAGFADFPMDMESDGATATSNDDALTAEQDAAAQDTTVTPDHENHQSFDDLDTHNALIVDADLQTTVAESDASKASAEFTEVDNLANVEDIVEPSQEVSHLLHTFQAQKMELEATELQPVSLGSEATSQSAGEDSIALKEQHEDSETDLGAEAPEATEVETGTTRLEFNHDNLDTADLTATINPESDALDPIQDDPSPSNILTAFRVCENHLMPNFPGWVELARPLHSSERRGKYAGGLYWMKTENLGRRLYQGLLVPQFDTLSSLRNIINELERRAYAEEFEEEKVGVFSRDGASVAAEAENKAWGDEEWGLGSDVKLEQEKRRLAREEEALKRQQEEDSREKLQQVILSEGEVPEEVEKRDIHVPADTILEAVKTWAPLTVDAAMTIPVVVIPEGFGAFKEMSKKKGWAYKTMKRWVRQVKSTTRKTEEAAEAEATEQDEERKAELTKRKEFFENQLEELETGPKTWTWRDMEKKAWLRKVSDREKNAIRQSQLKRSKRDTEFRVSYPTDRKGKALFVMGEGPPPDPEDELWLQKLDEQEEERKKDEARRRELDREFRRMAEEERQALEGGALFDDDSGSNKDRMKRSKRRLAKDKKKDKNVAVGDVGETLAEVGDALSVLEKGGG